MTGTMQFSGASYAPVTLTAGAGTATWEVTASNPNTIETLTFNLVLVYSAGVSVAGITYTGALAPVSSGLAPAASQHELFPCQGSLRAPSLVPPPATVTLSAAPQSCATSRRPRCT